MTLKSRIAAALSWSERDVNSFSLAMLREIVRPVSPKLAAECSESIRTGTVLLSKEE